MIVISWWSYMVLHRQFKVNIGAHSWTQKPHAWDQTSKSAELPTPFPHVNSQQIWQVKYCWKVRAESFVGGRRTPCWGVARLRLGPWRRATAAVNVHSHTTDRIKACQVDSQQWWPKSVKAPCAFFPAVPPYHPQTKATTSIYITAHDMIYRTTICYCVCRRESLQMGMYDRDMILVGCQRTQHLSFATNHLPYIHLMGLFRSKNISAPAYSSGIRESTNLSLFLLQLPCPLGSQTLRKDLQVAYQSLSRTFWNR